jgi:hypothetical protein
MMNCKGCEMKRLWPNFELLTRNLPAGTAQTLENSVRMAGLRAEISTRDLQNTKQEC